MEKIHSAIQKARRERDAKLARDVRDAPAQPDPSADRQHGEADAPPIAAKATPEPASVVEPGQSSAWAALAQFKPDRRVMLRNRIVAYENGAQSSAYDVLRTNILRQMRANGWKRLAITSPTPGCGKTTTALNLGFSLSRLHDMRALVIEADLRRPLMRQTLRLAPRHMFAAYLAGEAEAKDHLAACGPGLAFGTNVNPTRHSAELLASAGVSARLDALDLQFGPQVTVFDMPPMLVSDDTIGFLPNVDCTLLIAAAGVTTTAQIDRCERALAEQTNVLGVVLNKCQFMAADEYYGYDYY